MTGRTPISDRSANFETSQNSAALPLNFFWNERDAFQELEDRGWTKEELDEIKTAREQEPYRVNENAAMNYILAKQAMKKLDLDMFRQSICFINEHQVENLKTFIESLGMVMSEL